MTNQPTALISNPQDMYPNMEYMRWDVINDLIKKNNYKTYLEIGVYNRVLNFNQIKAPSKFCVDPDPNANADYVGTSNRHFEYSIANNIKWDIIFIDGLHTAEQVYKDIINALQCLNDGGTIVCHDMNPTSELMANPTRKTRLWCGNCWEAWMKLRHERRDLSMCVIDTDFGIGIIQRGAQPRIKKYLFQDLYNWKEFQKHKREWLRLFSVSEFKKLYL